MDSLLFALSVAFALVAGMFGWMTFFDLRQRGRYKSSVFKENLRRSSLTNPDQNESALNAKVLVLLRKETKEWAVHGVGARSGVLQGNFSERFSRIHGMLQSAWFCEQVGKAGLDGEVSEQGFCLSRVRLALSIGIVALLVGALFSTEFGLIMACAGVIYGWRLPKKVVSRRIESRAHQMEHHLPEMLDVIALGMRSGLSFDASIKLYATHFGTYLAHELSNVQRQWLSGLEYRDEGLRKLADSYDSPVFKRVVETIIRSVRFGSSMVESLEEQSVEARVAYRTRREEQVARAPVKMMIPTGTLILPAMLMLVVGPVLLELMGGGL